MLSLLLPNSAGMTMKTEFADKRYKCTDSLSGDERFPWTVPVFLCHFQLNGDLRVVYSGDGVQISTFKDLPRALERTWERHY